MTASGCSRPAARARAPPRRAMGGRAILRSFSGQFDGALVAREHHVERGHVPAGQRARAGEDGAVFIDEHGVEVLVGLALPEAVGRKIEILHRRRAAEVGRSRKVVQKFPPARCCWKASPGRRGRNTRSRPPGPARAQAELTSSMARKSIFLRMFPSPFHEVRQQRRQEQRRAGADERRPDDGEERRGLQAARERQPQPQPHEQRKRAGAEGEEHRLPPPPPLPLQPRPPPAASRRAGHARRRRSASPSSAKSFSFMSCPPLAFFRAAAAPCARRRSPSPSALKFPHLPAACAAFPARRASAT